jgi:diguanylate cyclase (GGDEF)-like protein
MPGSAIDRVLSCPNLPTLPGVAVRVLELTRDPHVAMTAIAQTVQNDPALSTKVLKTVNSSYYGLATPCPSISRAMSLLGLNTVKSLVLGFSLVDCTKKIGAGGGFDLEAHWRRAVYSAAGARAAAMASRGCDPEEAFVGALVQDIGSLACFAALHQEYMDALADAPEDHDAVAAIERDALGFDHIMVGRQLAERWRLPSQLVECITHHHDPERAPGGYRALVRCVAIGRLAAASLTLKDARPALARFNDAAREWFNLESEESRELLDATARGAREVSKLLDLNTGAAPDVGSIIAQAMERIIENQEQMTRETVELRQRNEELAHRTITDGLTGAFNRAHYDREIRECFDRFQQSNEPFAVIFIDADKFKSVNDTHGHQTGDAVLIELARRFRDAIGKNGVVCRYGGEEFGILLPRVGLDKATRVAELIREAIDRSPIDLRQHESPLESLHVTISLGVSALEAGLAQHATTPEQVTQAADQGVYAAKHAGRNCVRAVPLGSGSPREAAPRPSAVATAGQHTLMIVEDDPLASKLLAVLIGKRKDFRVITVRTGEEAIDWLTGPLGAGRPKPDAVLCDLYLPNVSGLDVLRRVRGQHPRLPFIVVSAAPDAGIENSCTAAGADAFIDKGELCTAIDPWMTRIAHMIEASAKSTLQAA